jgi:4-amino-4-deoxy-L-arabinose transferase-like glycosyltransferase
LAVALFACTPTIVWEATTAYVDLTLTVLVGLSLLSLIFFVNERKQHWLLLAAMTLGFAMATKHLSLLVLAIVGPGLFLLLWYRERQWRIVIRPTMIFIVICVLIPLPWYIRAWSASGNPFFPDLFGVFGALPELRWNEFTETGLQGFKDRFGVGRALPDLLLLPWHVTVNGYRFGGSLGPLYLLLISGLILPAVTHQKWLKWIGIFVLIFFVLWALPISSFQLRFLLLLTPWLAVLAAEGFGRIKLALHAGRKGNYVLTIGLAFLLLLNLPPFLSLHEGNQPGYADWLTHVVRTIPLGVVIGYESEASYLSRNVPTYAAWQAIDTLLPEDALILTFAGGDHLYATRDRYRDSAPRVIAPVWRATADAVEPARAALASAGVTHILYDKELLDSELGSLAIVQPNMVSAWEQPLYEDDHYFLLALRR